MRILLINLVLLYSISILGMENLEDPVVAGASYVIYEGSEADITGGILPTSKWATFYTATGDFIKQVTREEAQDTFCSLRANLDSTAPKPQPTTYKIQYCPAIKIEVPGHFIVFYDKNGNCVASYRYDLNTKEIKDWEYNQNTVAATSIADLKNIDTSICKEVVDTKNDQVPATKTWSRKIYCMIIGGGAVATISAVVAYKVYKMLKKKKKEKLDRIVLK